MNMTTNFMNWSNPGTALITGASAGLGAEFARQLASQGFKIILVARRKDKLEEIARKLTDQYQVKTNTLVADLANMSDNNTVMKYIDKIDDLDILINNAGFGSLKDFLQTDIWNHTDMLNLHCTAPIQFCYKALQGMKNRGRGIIINVSSIAALIKDPYNIMYTSTKEFINVFSQILQKNFKDTGILIQSLCPGFTYTEFHDSIGMKGFDRNWFPKEQWMTAGEVVSMSLNAFKEHSVVFIPGEFNRKRVKKYLESQDSSTKL